eukprot:TRINITY_DN111069_c0_g1_i1.p1 TRINITY_DN111069_c0_g1~~TRINITY_DN111069_c0_g1_i1.p1  ORF type:complete len:277 (-),score=45.59 TRINITY_DN111069_c0_g1_i1:102-932(-)
MPHGATEMGQHPRAAEISIEDRASSWQALGFEVHDEAIEGRLCSVVRLQSFRIILNGAQESDRKVPSLGLAGLSLSKIQETVHGVRLHAQETLTDDSAKLVPCHANGVVSLDHLVIRTPDIKSTRAAFAKLGMHPRRETEAIRLGLVQLFYRSEVQPSPAIEVVGPLSSSSEAAEGDSEEGSAQLWGLTFTTKDIDGTHRLLEKSTKPPWKAVQPGRRITTLQNGSSMGITMAIAFLSPHVKDETPKDARDVRDAEAARAQERELLKGKPEQKSRL